MEELSEEQERELADDLVRLKSELADLLDISREGTQTVELDQPIGRLTRMDALQQQKMAQASRGGHQVRARQVEAALKALKQGEYGYCRRCEEAIGYRRLKAKPETPFCLGCQSASERR